MAITAAPFALKNLGLDAEPLRQAVSSLVPNGGGIVQTGDFAVTQTGTPSLGVSVGVGRVWTPGNNTANVSGQAYSTQGMYFAINDGPVTVNLTTANATNPRIDLIYVGTVDTQYGGASNVIKIDKITGTPAATPVAPTLPAGSNAIALSQVAVAANATSVTNANITNIAIGAIKPFGHMGRTQSFKTLSGAGVVIDMAAAQELRGGMTFDVATSSLVVPIGGFYRFTVKGMGTGSSGVQVFFKSQANLTDIPGVFGNSWKAAADDLHWTFSATKRLNAGDKINLIGGYGTGASMSTWGTNGYDGCWVELEYVGAA